MRSIAVPRQMPDPPDAVELRVTRGAIRFEDVHFDYRPDAHRGAAVSARLDLRSRRASGSGWSGRRARANRRW